VKRISEILSGFMSFPEARLDAVLGSKKALILAPHPDDESLACGGLIAAACAMGAPPIIAFLTDGSASHPGSISFPPERLRMVREKEALQAAEALGLDDTNLVFLRYRDGCLPSSGDVFSTAVDRVREIARVKNCDLLIGPWLGDPHCDHVAGATIAAAAAETKWSLLSYPVWGWLRNRDDLFNETRKNGWKLNITPYLDRKKNAVSAHVSQLGGLIKDSPAGFTIPKALLEVSERDFEVFIS
jgi:LmbE family N-acetylglucosaminyl deacetylase